MFDITPVVFRLLKESVNSLRRYVPLNTQVFLKRVFNRKGSEAVIENSGK